MKKLILFLSFISSLSALAMPHTFQMPDGSQGTARIDIPGGEGGSGGSGGGYGYGGFPGSAGIANTVNTLFANMGHRSPPLDVSHIEARIEGHRAKIREYDEAKRKLEERMAVLDLEAQSCTVKPLPEINQAYQEARIAEAAQRMFDRLLDTAQTGIATHLPDARDLAQEVSGWRTFTLDKKKVLDLINKYSTDAARATASDLSEENSMIYKTIQNAGIESLTEAAQITEGHLEGDFSETLGASQSTLEMGKAFLDVAMGLTPGVGFGKDCYEAFLGKSLIDGSELDLTSRSFAVLGVATAGGTTILKNSVKGLIKIGHALHARGLATHGLHSAIHVAESGITDIVRHGPLMGHGGVLHATPLINSNGVMTTVAQTFRSETYYAYKTTEPITLYRVVANTVSDAAAHQGAFWTRVKPTGGTQAMIDSALDLSWKNNGTKWVEIIVPAGETLYEGVSASILPIGHYTSQFIGGGNQVYINKFVDVSWVKVVGSF